jgi:dTDP-4-amino-4,6-dideoxy-D-galactose acyltransferase
MECVASDSGQGHSRINEPCIFLTWDSDFFGRRIARIEEHCLNQQSLRAILLWCRAQDIDCLYFLADSDDPTTICLAENHGFRFVEIRTTYKCSLKNWISEFRPYPVEELIIRPVRSDDIPALMRIGGTIYCHSRFYRDGGFTWNQWQSFYATWIKASCEGRADWVFVAELHHQIVGYISGILHRENNEGQFELTGVEPSHRGGGIGHALFREGLNEFVRAGMAQAVVHTQGHNVATQRMIQRHGFLVSAVHIHYHKWFLDL